VEVDQGPGLPHKLINVTLDYNSEAGKPYLGGFRHKGAGTTYHHSCSQTPSAPKTIVASTRLCRETQTVDMRNNTQQTDREAGTQMPKAGLVLDESRDRWAGLQGCGAGTSAWWRRGSWWMLAGTAHGCSARLEAHTAR
jgi:hypothetical protein